MVAISLYRGNLHRVPDVPRRWLMPTHKITLKDFKSLLHKREKTLSRLHSTIVSTTTSNPNSSAEQQQQQREFVGDNDCSKQNNTQITIEPPPQPKTQATDKAAVDNKLKTERLDGDDKDQSGGGGDTAEEQRKGIGDSLPIPDPDPKSAAPQNVCEVKDAGAPDVVKEEKQLNLAGPAIEMSNNADLLSDKEKKKKDLEQNLKVLNERKHNLVQMLKQILTAEEEIKRRNSVQASIVRPPIPQQVDATTDVGSNPRQVVNRTGPEANFCGDLEGESEDVSNHNTQSRQLHHMRSTSPTASSPLRKLAHSSIQLTAVPHPNRSSLVVNGQTQGTSSPSRFAPLGYQGHPANLPPLSVSGTHYTASSPSPAGSGGTSVFRDARITSPSWN